MGPILLVLAFQVIVMTIFASYIVYRVMGRSYDACVIAAGFVGLGIGATPRWYSKYECCNKQVWSITKSIFSDTLSRGVFY